MQNYSLKLINQEFQDLAQNPIAAIGVCVGIPDENNPYEWRCTMIGPNDTSFAGGLFYLKIKFPKDYPDKAPEVLFVTPIYHVNVNHINQPKCPLGHICISTLNIWNPEYRVREILTNIFALFYMGNPDSPYGLERAEELRNNRAIYEEKIKYFTKKYANPMSGGNNLRRDQDWNFNYP